MGLRDHLKVASSPNKGANDAPPEGAAPENSEALDEESGNVLLHLIAQLRPGMDLSRVALPTFVLEPRSMLERVGDSLSHADLVFGSSEKDDPLDRFIDVLRYFLSGWHVRTPGVKKPYNPVLGEYFRCRFEYSNGTQGWYLAEQTSHHPPVSCFAFYSPENNLEIHGELRPKSKFLGNSAATLMGGESRLRFLDRPEDGQYVISMPNMYARGILFGKMVFELGDDCKVVNTANDIVCDLDFKTKGFFSGAYNAIAGKIRAEGKDIGDVSGFWNEAMELKRVKGGNKQVLFDARGAKPSPKVVAPLAEQGEYESRRLWTKVTDAIKAKDMKAATDSKVDIEEAQRERTAKREEAGETWSPRYFRLDGETYVPVFRLPEDPKERIEAVHRWIFGDDSSPPQSTSSGTSQSGAAATSAAPVATSQPAGAQAIRDPVPEPVGVSNSRNLPTSS